MNVKQVIVIRKDLKMRRGKEIAQGCHASMGVITNQRHWLSFITEKLFGITMLKLTKNSHSWLNNRSFTKVTVTVNSLEELLQVKENAESKGLKVCMITDSGKTEFDGVPTVTCLSIEPATDDQLEGVTKHLKLY
jgi:PTH2 family peptidyl-tRNA hydrolase